jgi:hypothetical protein
MDKIKVLVIVRPAVDGCVYFRQWSPHVCLHRIEGFEVQIVDGISYLTDEQLSQFKIAHIHKGYYGPQWIPRLKDLGMKVIVDFDDYWFLPTSHGMYDEYYFEHVKKPDGSIEYLKDEQGKYIRRKYTSSDFFIDMMKHCDWVTVSTPMLADAVRLHNKNVAVFENAIDPTEDQWRITENSQERVRFGWIGGAMHWPDIQLLRGVPNRLHSDTNTKGKYEMRLFGYQRNSIFVNFANIFTNYGQYLDSALLFPARPVLQQSWDKPAYSQYYNDLDVALAPLVDDKFNRLKSELKMVEAGFFKKAMIVSNVYPYKYIINNNNCKAASNTGDWFKHMKFFINNRSAMREYGEALYETVKDKYDQRNVAKRRAEFYRSL